jgi:hypothetical protein
VNHWFRPSAIIVVCSTTCLLLACGSGTGAGPGSSAGSSGESGPSAAARTTSGGGGAGADAARDGCAIATNAEVAQATGLDVLGHTTMGAFSCQWQVASDDPSTEPYVEWLPTTIAAFHAAPADAAAAGMNSEPVSGLGDEAYTMAPRGSKPVEYWVRVGDVAFGVRGSLTADVDLAGTIRPLAELIAERL